MSNDFDWSDDLVVVHEQPKTAVYLNPHGQVVVRQEQWPDEDQYVYLSREFAEIIARAIVEAAGIEPATVFGQPRLLSPPQKNGTGAERSRRYRERHSQRDADSVTDASVTRDDDRHEADAPLLRQAAE